MDIGKRISRARARMIVHQPFYAAIAMRRKLVADESCQTFYTNGKQWGYNPAFADKLTDDELVAVLAHEANHDALMHDLRRGERDPRGWNIAADLAINPMLKDAGLSLPAGGLFPDQADWDLSAEDHYAKLPESDKDGSGDGDPGCCGEVRDNPGKGSPAEMAKAEQQRKVEVVQAAQAARAQGTLPGSIERLVDALAAPVVDWREELREFVERSAGYSDYTYSIPNRRYMGTGFILPSLIGEQCPPIVIAVDTSGSVDAELLQRFSSEVFGVLEQVRPQSVTVIYCDTGIQSVEEFQADDLPECLRAVGGGGTDFIPPFQEVERLGIDPACLIYFTDLYCNSFPDDPGYPVLWAADAQPIEPPFGRVVRID